MRILRAFIRISSTGAALATMACIYSLEPAVYKSNQDFPGNVFTSPEIATAIVLTPNKSVTPEDMKLIIPAAVDVLNEELKKRGYEPKNIYAEGFSGLYRQGVKKLFNEIIGKTAAAGLNGVFIAHISLTHEEPYLPDIESIRIFNSGGSEIIKYTISNDPVFSGFVWMRVYSAQGESLKINLGGTNGIAILADEIGGEPTGEKDRWIIKNIVKHEGRACHYRPLSHQEAAQNGIRDCFSGLRGHILNFVKR